MIRKFCVTPTFVNMKCALRCFSEKYEINFRSPFLSRHHMRLWIWIRNLCEALKRIASIVKMCLWKGNNENMSWNACKGQSIQTSTLKRYFSFRNSIILYHNFPFKANKLFFSLSRFISHLLHIKIAAINRASRCQTLFFLCDNPQKRKKHLSLETFSPTLII